RIEGMIGQAIEAHRRAARRHHADDDPQHPLPAERHEPRCEQRARQRKRQREDRMAETDERSVGAEPRDHVGTGRIASGGTPPTRYSSTSRTPAGTSTATSAAALPGARVPYRSPAPSASAPVRVALSSSDAAVTSGATRRSSASSSNMFSEPTDARLSVPIAMRAPAA